MKQNLTLIAIFLVMVSSLFSPVISNAQGVLPKYCEIACESSNEHASDMQVTSNSTMLALGYSMILIGFGFLVLNLQISAILEKRG
jgi:hypothetical protein